MGSHSVCVLTALVIVAILASAGWARLDYEFHSRVRDEVLRRKLAPIWEPTVKMLMDVIVDADIRREMRTAIVAAHAAHNVIDVCTSRLVTCTEEQEELVVSGLTFTGLDAGMLRWEHVPPSVKAISVVGGNVTQRFFLSHLPPTVEVFESIHTHWPAVEELAFADESDAVNTTPATSPQLTVLRFVGSDITGFRTQSSSCGDEGCIAKFAPELLGLDLSHNHQLTELNIETLPSRLTLLALKDMPSWRPAASITTNSLFERFTALEKLELDVANIPFTLHDLAKMPSTMRGLRISGPAGDVTAATTGQNAADANQDISQLEEIFTGGRTLSLESLALIQCGLTGTLPDLAGSTLSSLDLSRNALAAVPFAHLPTTLLELNLSRSGIATDLPPLSELPAKLVRLDVSHNQYTGSVELGKLPATVVYLDLSHNSLSGPVDTPRLPDVIREVYIQGNRFTGELDLVDLPVFIRFIHVYDNDWHNPLPTK